VVAGIQAKLKVGQPGDIYEQEADRVADEVMRMPEPQVQGRVEEEEEPVQMESISSKAPEVTSELQTRINALKGNGKPLPESERARAFFEPRFGYDFSKVRIHTDSRANETAQEINARAFTLGNNIVFGPGQYLPGTVLGRRLLGHELTHVLQQRSIYSEKIFRTVAQVSSAINSARRQFQQRIISTLRTQRQRDLLSAITSVLTEFFPRGFGVKDAQGSVTTASARAQIEQPVANVGVYRHEIQFFISEQNLNNIGGEYISRMGHGEIIIYVPTNVNRSVDSIAELLAHETVHLFTDVRRQAVAWGRQQQRQGTQSQSPGPNPPTTGGGIVSPNLTDIRLLMRDRQVSMYYVDLMNTQYPRVIRFLNVRRIARGEAPLDVNREAARWAGATVEEMLAFCYAEQVRNAMISPGGQQPSQGGPQGYVSIFDPGRFFYGYALNEWVSNPDDRNELNQPQGCQILRDIGQSRALQNLYGETMTWINQ
jgi:hypothetical protein